FTTVEEMPVFPGGMNMLSEFLGYNLVMPKLAKERGLTGRVFVMFTIMQDGAVGDLKVIKGIGLGCDEAALFAVSVLPDWKPGYQRGKPVKVRMTLPITFR
ncbi:MAG: energy transducer TonB, partial [Bacteroidota bacterium]